MSNCFVYGTLMAEEVLQCLIKRVPKQRPARISGFRRHALRKQVFPATVPTGSPTDSVVGKVLLGLSEEEMAVFDAFEGEEYYKHDVTATLLRREDAKQEEEEEEKIETFLYCWSEEARSELLPEDWDYSAFRKNHLQRYVGMCRGFEEELREEARAASAAARSEKGGSGGE